MGFLSNPPPVSKNLSPLQRLSYIRDGMDNGIITELGQNLAGNEGETLKNGKRLC